MLEGQTFAQFWLVWCQAPNATDGIDLWALNEKIRRRRKELGLPPSKPNKKV